jgi:hypothetical protein
MLPANALGGVRLLLQLENVLHEELLQRFVCVVDAELLETAIKLKLKFGFNHHLISLCKLDGN